MRRTSAPTPPTPATMPACLTIPRPPTFSTQPVLGLGKRHGKGGRLLLGVAGYQGVLMSNECVTPKPIVTWSGEPRWETIGEPATSPLSRSYSRKTGVAHAGVHR